MPYTELQVTTNFSFLRGGSHPEELVEHAVTLGYKALAITDRNTLAGIVRGHVAAKAKGLRLIPACRLDLLDGPSLMAYPTSKEAYAQLSGLLTLGNRRAEKGECHLYKADVYAYTGGIKFIVAPPDSLNERFDFDPAFKTALREYRQALGTDLYLGAICTYGGDDGKKLYRLSNLAKELAIPMVATNDVHYHHHDRRELQDILTCIREKCTIHTAGFRLCANAERYLKPGAEMERLFRQYPDAIRRSEEIAAACTFSLDTLEYVYPEEITKEGRTPQEELEMLAWKGAKELFPDGIPEKISDTIREELEFMERKNYAAYFLTVYDFVDFARKQNILCQGRGSAANSVVCYCLGITSVNPAKFKLLFARFMSDARDEPPDIDVDFEHERREEVIQYIFNKYGRDRAAIVATVTQLHSKGAIRDVGKAMGLSVDAINRLSGSIWEFTDEWFEGKLISQHGFDPKDLHLIKVLELTRQFMGFPRQLGQHTGGFVITQGKLSDLCPILNARMKDRTCIEWNKDDIEALGFLKVDVLALGMLTCIRKAFDLIKAHYGKDYTLASIPQDEEEVYKMISAADTIGVFQIESRAQMSMLPRLRPKCFYDLVIEVAIVRPGPIQGDMVHPYLRRRNGEEDIEYPNPELEEILGRTLGVPLFQEQAMEIAIVAAGFTPAEADGLRRSMATFKAKGMVSDFKQKLVSGMMAKGYEEEFAQRVFKQLEGFGSYGFPESHAVSFALLVYVSSWIKYKYPDVFATALLNSMPMGFYQPAQIIIDARKHEVEIRPVDVNYSAWDNLLEEKTGEYCPIRLGFRQVKGLRQEDIEILLAARESSFTSGSYAMPLPVATSPLLSGSAAHFPTAFPPSKGESASTKRPSVLKVSYRNKQAAASESGIPPFKREMSAVKADEGDVFPATGRLYPQCITPFTSIHALMDAGVSQAALEKLADADAFNSMGLDRRAALWEIATLHDRPTGMFEGQPSESALEEAVQLPRMTLSEHVVQDYGSTALSLKAHPVSFVREKLDMVHVLPNNELHLHGNGAAIKVAGLVLVRQRPGTAAGICFITIEDETGTANLVVFKNLFGKYRKEILQARLLMVEGILQREGEVTHVIVSRCFDMSGLLRHMTVIEEDTASLLTLSRADEREGEAARNKDPRVRKAVQAEIFPGGRNFR